LFDWLKIKAFMIQKEYCQMARGSERKEEKSRNEVARWEPLSRRV